MESRKGDDGSVRALRQTLAELRKYRTELVADGVFDERYEQDRSGRWIPEPRLRQLDRIIAQLEEEHP